MNDKLTLFEYQDKQIRTITNDNKNEIGKAQKNFEFLNIHVEKSHFISGGRLIYNGSLSFAHLEG